MSSDSYVTKDSGHPRFRELLDEAWELHQRKAQQYGSNEDPLANLHAHVKMGYAPYDASLIEIANIGTRLVNLCRQLKAGKDVSKAMKNALMDNAAFSYLAIVTMEEAGALDSRELTE